MNLKNNFELENKISNLFSKLENPQLNLKIDLPKNIIFTDMLSMTICYLLEDIVNNLKNDLSILLVKKEKSWQINEQIIKNIEQVQELIQLKKTENVLIFKSYNDNGTVDRKMQDNLIFIRNHLFRECEQIITSHEDAIRAKYKS